MKQILSLLLILFMTTSAMAQAPESVSYQAVIRNGEGKLVSEKPVGIRINILLQTEQGNAVYTETHLVNSNINGLVTFRIGTGTVILGTFQKIDWGNGRYFLQTEIDPSGGTNYSIKNVSQMLSVPYALFAKSAGKVEGGWTVKGNVANKGDFLGTTNEQPLEFKLNNSTVGYFDLKQNIFFGAIAGGSTTGEGNIAMGTRSLQFNTTGEQNIAIGNYALHRSVTGSNNVALGQNALINNNSGGYNIAVGAQSMNSNKSGEKNVAIGAYSLNANDDGVLNTATGHFSLSKNLKGIQNVANGASALYKNTLGNSNVANGYSSLYSNIGGSFNVANGEYSLYSNTSGEANTAIGSKSLYSNLTGENNVAIGNQVLYKNISGSNNVGSGTAALYENRKGKENVAYGFGSLGANIDGSRNAAFGYNSLEKNNYGNGGVGNDNVFAQGQDGASLNNAYFGTPPDGASPSMTMFLWSAPVFTKLVTINTGSIAGPYTALNPSVAAGNNITGASAIPVTANLIIANDGTANASEGCNAYTNPSAYAGKIVLIKRGTCNFVDKIQRAQNAGAVGVIVMNHNNPANDPTHTEYVSMGGMSTPAFQVFSRVQRCQSRSWTMLKRLGCRRGQPHFDHRRLHADTRRRHHLHQCDHGRMQCQRNPQGRKRPPKSRWNRRFFERGTHGDRYPVWHIHPGYVKTARESGVADLE